MNDKNTYKSKLRSSNKSSSESKSELFSPKSDISKRYKISRKMNGFSRKCSQIKCTDCKELINKEKIQSHRENCVKNQKKCPYCSEFFPSRLISSHINVCNTSSGSSNNLPYIGRNTNSRVNDPKPQATPLIRKKNSNLGNPEPHSNENPNGFGSHNQPNATMHGANRIHPGNYNFPNINSNNNTSNSNARRNNNNANTANNTSNSNNIPTRDPFSSIFEDFSGFNSSNSPPHLFNRFSQDSNGNQFFFSNEFSNSENNNRPSNNFPNNQQQERDRNPFTHVFFQRANNDPIAEGRHLLYTDNRRYNNSNQNQNGFGNLNSNPFSEFDSNGIFGSSGVFTRIREEMRNMMNPGVANLQQSYSFRTMPFERDENDTNNRFVDFSFFIDNPIFVTFRNSRENRARGLNPDEINNIPTSTFNPKPPAQEKKDQNTTAKSCVVCLEDFKMGDQLKTLVCQHKFHKTCIEHWLVIKGSCPVCRVNLSRSEV